MKFDEILSGINGEPFIVECSSESECKALLGYYSIQGVEWAGGEDIRKYTHLSGHEKIYYYLYPKKDGRIILRYSNYSDGEKTDRIIPFECVNTSNPVDEFDSDSLMNFLSEVG